MERATENRTNGTRGRKKRPGGGAVEYRYRGGHGGNGRARNAAPGTTPPPLPPPERELPWERGLRPLTAAEWARNIGLALACAAIVAGILWAFG